MSLTRIYLILLMIFFSAASAFGREPTRKALVDTAYYQLPFVIEFLMESPEFQDKLTAEEKDQLWKLYRITAALAQAHQYRFVIGPNGFAGAPKDKGLPKLEYSADPQIFKLSPAEPERSAMTPTALSEPIYINLRYLDSPTQDPSYMDILQILFHELGHKLGAEKKQALIDSLGGKMVQFLKPYYQKLMLSEKLKLEALSLPLDFTRFHVRPSNTPMVVLQENGHAEYHRLDLSRVADRFLQFTPDAGNMAEVVTLRFLNFSGKLGHEGHLSYGVHFNLEIKSQPVYNDPRMDVRGFTAGVDGAGALIAAPRRWPLAEPNFVNLEASIRLGRPEPRHIPQLVYVETSHSAWEYRDLSIKHRVQKVQRSQNQIQLQITNPVGIGKVNLRLRSGSADFQIPGEALKGTEGIYQFQIPTHLRTESGEIQISEVTLNGQSKLPLPEVIKFKTALAPNSQAPQLKGIQYFDGQNWQAYDDRKILKMPEGPIRFRIQVESESSLTQIRLLWNKGSNLYWGDPESVIGILASMEEEIVKDLKFVSKNDKTAVYEFSSTEVLRLRLPQTPQPFGAFDSQRRFLKEMSLVTSNMEMQQRQFSQYLMLFTGEYTQVKSLKYQVRSCSRVH